MNDEIKPPHYTDEEKLKRLIAWHAMDQQEIEKLMEENSSLRAQSTKQANAGTNFLSGWKRPKSRDQ